MKRDVPVATEMTGEGAQIHLHILHRCSGVGTGKTMQVSEDEEEIARHSV